MQLSVTWDEENNTAFIGKIPAASYHWDGTRQRNDPKKYAVTSQLPKIKRYLGNYETEEEAIAKCISAANTFIRLLNETK